MTDHNPNSSIDEQYYDDFDQHPSAGGGDYQQPQQQAYEPNAAHTTAAAAAGGGGTIVDPNQSVNYDQYDQSHSQQYAQLQHQHDDSAAAAAAAYHPPQPYHPYHQQPSSQTQQHEYIDPSTNGQTQATSTRQQQSSSQRQQQYPHPHQQQQQQQAPHPSLYQSGSAQQQAYTDPLRPTIPPYLHSSLGSSQPAPAPAPAPVAVAAPIVAPASLPVDPRSTADYQVAWELELWRRSEVRAQQERWKVEEASRMKILEEEFAKAMKSEEAKLQVRILKVQQQEKSIGLAQLELEKARFNFRNAQNDLASRVASLDKELASHKDRSEVAISKMKDQTSYEVSKVRLQMKDISEANDLLKKQLKACQTKLLETQEEGEKERLKHAKSNFGAVEQALRRKEDELASMTKKWQEALAEKDYERSRLQAALGKAMSLHQQIEHMKQEALEQKNRDADFLREQYKAKEAQSGASRSVAEMHELRKLVKAQLQASAVPPTTRTAIMGGSGSEIPVHQPAFMAGASLPAYSTAAPNYNSFVPPPPASQPTSSSSFVPSASVPLPVSDRHALYHGVAPSSSTTTSSSIGSHTLGPASIPSRANLPQPYQYLVHEQEVLTKVASEREGQTSKEQRTGGGQSRERQYATQQRRH